MATLADAQAIANITAKQIGLATRPKVEIGARLEAFTDENRITIPAKLLTYSAAIFTYSVIHEVCHFHNGGIHHGKEFRKVEDRMMEFWHLSFKRKGHYMQDVRYK